MSYAPPEQMEAVDSPATALTREGKRKRSYYRKWLRRCMRKWRRLQGKRLMEDAPRRNNVYRGFEL